jgi:hypothetical protein
MQTQSTATTDQGQRLNPEAHVTEIASMVMPLDPYIDTCLFLAWDGQRRRKIDALDRLCAGGLSDVPVENERTGFTVRSIQMQRPTLNAFTYAATLRGTQWISRLHIAQEWEAPSLEVAEFVQHWLRRRLLKLWRGQREVGAIEDTRYWDDTGAVRRGIASYAEAESRITGNPVARIEWK